MDLREKVMIDGLERSWGKTICNANKREKIVVLDDL
jgi:hypothetical protein